MQQQEGSPDRDRLVREFIDSIPHCRALGIEFDEIGTGTVALSMPYDPRFIGDPRTGVVHGGVICALMDTCCGAAVRSYSASILHTATLDLRIDYLRAATPGQRLRARAECYHVTRSVAFLRASATDDDADRPVASVTGAFTVEHAEART